MICNWAKQQWQQKYQLLKTDWKIAEEIKLADRNTKATNENLVNMVKATHKSIMR